MMIIRARSLISREYEHKFPVNPKSSHSHWFIRPYHPLSDLPYYVLPPPSDRARHPLTDEGVL